MIISTSGHLIANANKKNHSWHHQEDSSRISSSVRCQTIKGSYVSTSVGSFVFHDRKVVCFATNVFPEQIGSKVASTKYPDGVLWHQSKHPPPHPSLLPAYMC